MNSSVFKSLQKEAARLRASAHQETIRLQNQAGPSAPYQGPNSDEEGEAVKNHDQGERGGESDEEVVLASPQGHGTTYAPVTTECLSCCYSLRTIQRPFLLFLLGPLSHMESWLGK